MAGTSYRIEKLNPSQHYCGGFCCGTPELDKYLQQRAWNESSKDLNTTYVLCDEQLELVEGQAEVIGYHTIAIGSIVRDAMPIKGYNTYPELGVLHLGRLAVHQDYQGKGLGGYLLSHAMELTMRLAEQVSACGLHLIAADEGVAQWYKKHGLVETADDKERHLFIPVATIRDTFHQAASVTAPSD